jgi:hypothetical protein
MNLRAMGDQRPTDFLSASFFSGVRRLLVGSDEDSTLSCQLDLKGRFAPCNQLTHKLGKEAELGSVDLLGAFSKTLLDALGARIGIGRGRTMKPEFLDKSLVLRGYPFGTNVRRIDSSDVRELCVGWAPPTLLLSSGEFVFVSAEFATGLSKWVLAQNVPFVSRFDVWSHILDPFLDTKLSPEEQKRTMALLGENGVAPEEVKRMRELVGLRMWMLTFATWEWMHYGLFDVFKVMKPFCILSGWTFTAFQKHAMELARRPTPTPSTIDAL